MEKKKHADNCAPTLLKFLREAFRFENEEESKAEVRWQKSETNKEESKPDPIYSVVRFRPHFSVTLFESLSSQLSALSRQLSAILAGLTFRADGQQTCKRA